MTRYRVTIGLRQGRFGPTETYISPDITETALGPTVQNLIDKRNAMLFTNALWDGVRIGQADLVRRAQLYPPGIYTAADDNIELTVPSAGIRALTPVDKRPDQARSCLHIRIMYGDQRSTLRYLSLVPDAIVVDEPQSLVRTRDNEWLTAYNNFVAFLVQGQWAIRARQRLGAYAPFPIGQWSQETAAPFRIGVSVKTTLAPSIVDGDEVAINGVRRRGTDRTSYNGHYFVDAVNLTAVPDYTTYYLRGTESGNPDSVKRKGTISKVGYQYFPMQTFSAIRSGIHKRGNGLNPPHGRNKQRAKLDP